MNNAGDRITKDTGGSALKADIIKDAYSKLRISGLTVNPTPEDLDAALVRLENMVAEWESRNISTGYNFQDSPDPNDGLNVSRSYWQALSANLAVTLIPDFNKEVPQVLLMQARSSLSSLSGRSAMNRINHVPSPVRQPRGSGSTLRWNRWARFYRGSASAPNSAATNAMVVGDIGDYVEHFDSFLDREGGEFILSASITTDPALKLVSESFTETDVNFRVEALSTTSSGTLSNQMATIVVGTDTGRRETRFVYFNISPVKSNA